MATAPGDRDPAVMVAARVSRPRGLIRRQPVMSPTGSGFAWPQEPRSRAPAPEQQRIMGPPSALRCRMGKVTGDWPSLCQSLSWERSEPQCLIARQAGRTGLPPLNKYQGAVQLVQAALPCLACHQPFPYPGRTPPRRRTNLLWSLATVGKHGRFRPRPPGDPSRAVPRHCRHWSLHLQHQGNVLRVGRELLLGGRRGVGLLCEQARRSIPADPVLGH